MNVPTRTTERPVGFFERLYAAIQRRESKEEKRPKPGEWMSRKASAAGKAFRQLRRLNSAEQKATRAAAIRTARLRGKFEKEGRQQMRRMAFELALLDVNEKYPAEPRRARRRIARVAARRTLDERKAA